MSQSSDLGSERNWHICQNLISTALTWCWSKMISLFLSILCAHPTVSSIHQTSFLACIVSRLSFDIFERNKAAAIYPVCLITQPSYSHNFPKTKTAINNRELLYLFRILIFSLSLFPLSIPWLDGWTRGVGPGRYSSGCFFCDVPRASSNATASYGFQWVRSPQTALNFSALEHEHCRKIFLPTWPHIRPAKPPLEPITCMTDGMWH